MNGWGRQLSIGGVLADSNPMLVRSRLWYRRNCYAIENPVAGILLASNARFKRIEKLTFDSLKIIPFTRRFLRNIRSPLCGLSKKGNNFNAGEVEADGHSTPGFYVHSIESDGKFAGTRLIRVL
jgi:hypothetical protein